MSYFSEVIELYKTKYNSRSEREYVQALSRGTEKLNHALNKGGSITSFCKAQLFSLLEDALDYKHKDVMRHLLSCVDDLNTRNKTLVKEERKRNGESEEDVLDVIPVEPFKFYSFATIKLVPYYTPKQLKEFYKLYDYAFKFALPNFLKRLIAYEKIYQQTHSKITYESERKKAIAGKWGEKLLMIAEAPFLLTRPENVEQMAKHIFSNFKKVHENKKANEMPTDTTMTRILNALSASTTTITTTITTTTEVPVIPDNTNTQRAQVISATPNKNHPEFCSANTTPILLQKFYSTASESKSHISPTPEDESSSDNLNDMLVQHPATLSNSLPIKLVRQQENNSFSGNEEAQNSYGSNNSYPSSFGQRMASLSTSSSDGKGAVPMNVEDNLTCPDNSLGSISDGSAMDEEEGESLKRPASTDLHDETDPDEQRSLQRARSH